MTPFKDLKSALFKTTDCALEDVIENYQEIKDVLQATKWRYCLEEAGRQAVAGSPIELVLGTAATP